MILSILNTLLQFLTRPYIYIQKYTLLTIQSYIPTYFDEKSWYILFGLMTFLALIIAYTLSRCVTLKDADDDPIYQRARFYSTQKQRRKMN